MRQFSSYRPRVDYFLYNVVLAIIVSVKAANVCDGPFSQFLRCMSVDTDARLDTYKNEVQPAIRSSIQQCFIQYKCAPPDFSKASLEFFIQEPWTSRVNAVLNVMETMDPEVQQCMTDYFKGQLSKRVNDCVKKNGPPDLKDFEMPPIPGGYNVDIPRMKQVILQRMMIQYQLSQCASIANDEASRNNLIGCIKKVRREADPAEMCSAREQCARRNIKESNCVDRYNKIRQTACQCFATEEGKKDTQHDIQNMLITGALEKKFKACHDTNGVPYPTAKVDAAKKQAKAAFMDALAGGGIPDGVKAAMKMGQQVMTEMIKQWKDGFCAECAAAAAAAAGSSKTPSIAPIAPSTAAAIAPPPAQAVPPIPPVVVPPPVPQPSSTVVDQSSRSSSLSNSLPSQSPPAAAAATSSNTAFGGGATGASSSSGQLQNGPTALVIPPPLPPQVQAQQPFNQQGFLEFQKNLARIFGPASASNG